MSFDTPILFLVFNRIDTAERVFAEIKNIKPKKLFIASDGPRQSLPQERGRVEAVRAMITKNIDWDCEVKTLFQEKNLGCKLAVSSAITWFFKNIEEGIILEDDCLPHPTFFNYCQSLLEKYRADERVMHIGGANFQNGIKRGDGSYYFSQFVHIWGWATWRRAWAHYDVQMKTFSEFVKQKQINNIFSDAATQKFWLNKFKLVYDNNLDTWDYQWVYSIWRRNGLAIIPNYNLVSNIGFGPGATHTKTKNIVANKKTEKMEEIIHPAFITVDKKADRYYAKSLNFFYRLFNKFKVYFVRPR